MDCCYTASTKLVVVRMCSEADDPHFTIGGKDCPRRFPGDGRLRGNPGHCRLRATEACNPVSWGIVARLRLRFDCTYLPDTCLKGTPPGKGGSNAPWGGWAYTTSEGGMRMPCIVRWPGKVPAATTCDELCTMMDILPTISTLAGAAIPQDTIIDGKNVWPLWLETAGAKTPHEVFYYYMAEQLQAVRSKKWKLHLPLQRMWRKSQGRPVKRKI